MSLLFPELLSPICYSEGSLLPQQHLAFAFTKRDEQKSCKADTKFAAVLCRCLLSMVGKELVPPALLCPCCTFQWSLGIK